jgi:hypothetical protein
MPLMVIAARASRRSFRGRVLVLVAERPRHACYEPGWPARLGRTNLQACLAGIH